MGNLEGFMDGKSTRDMKTGICIRARECILGKTGLITLFLVDSQDRGVLCSEVFYS